MLNRRAKIKDQENKKQTPHYKCPAQRDNQTNKVAEISHETVSIHDIITINDDKSETNSQSQDPPSQQPKRDLTFITGPCILKTFEIRFIGEKCKA